MTKQEFRQEVRRRFAQTSAEERQAWSKETCESLLSDPKLQSARVIMAFSPMKDEVNITPALDAFARQGKTILLPLVTSPTTMVPINMAHSVRANECSFEEQNKIDAVIVPGMAFTRQGVRLGRGRGYYDRFLPLVPRAYLRGVCFPYQIFDSLPHEPHDILVYV